MFKPTSGNDSDRGSLIGMGKYAHDRGAQGLCIPGRDEEAVFAIHDEVSCRSRIGAHDRLGHRHSFEQGRYSTRVVGVSKR